VSPSPDPSCVRDRVGKSCSFLTPLSLSHLPRTIYPSRNTISHPHSYSPATPTLAMRHLPRSMCAYWRQPERHPSLVEARRRLGYMWRHACHMGESGFPRHYSTFQETHTSEMKPGYANRARTASREGVKTLNLIKNHEHIGLLPNITRPGDV
jgi:hypothetical protein